jgi:type II secretory pathway predicted ATPase ExeA
LEHLSTFGLNRDPFGGDSQLVWYFEGGAFGSATKKLHRAAFQAKSLCLVTGRGGVGKTMLVRHLLDAFDEDVFEASMLVPVPGITDMRWLLTRWAQQLGVEEPESELSALLGQVYEQLAIVREDGRNAVLIVDEAQVLAERGLLAELRGLLNLEYEEKKLLTLVLVGSPSLADAVAAEPALRDRVDLRLVIPPLQPREVAGYLHHRIRAAGGNPAILESSAVEAITKLSSGIPRRVNAIADNALFEAHVEGRVSATAAHVERVAGELGFAAEPIEAPAPFAPAPKRRAAPAPKVELSEDEPEIELGEVVAEPTGRRGGPSRASAHTEAAMLELGRASSRDEGEPLLEDSGELEDLFADIVDE